MPLLGVRGAGTRRLRVTGGEPLVRRDIMRLFGSLSRHVDSSALDEITMTTNGSQLARYAKELAACGVRRVNVSLDTLDPTKFRAITRWGDLGKVMAGIDRAQAEGLAVKINTVASKDGNDREAAAMVKWAHGRGLEMTSIEVMPLGEIEGERVDQYLPLSQLRSDLASHFTMIPSSHASGGPARYFDAAETGGRLGFITPLTHNFCESCNRVRVTCTGTLYTCLGQEDATDLRTPLRQSEDDILLNAAIRTATKRKPKGHDFIIGGSARRPTVGRHMSVTGG